MVGRLIRRSAIAGAALVIAEALIAVLRPVPYLEEYDPSGEFGDPAQPRLRVAVLGDSSVTAPGVDGPDEIWIRRLCQRLSGTFHVTLRSFAISGSMAHDLIRDQLKPAIAFEPDLVFVAVGGNDVIKGVTLSQFERNLDELVGRLASRSVVVQSGVGDMGTIPRLHPPLRELMTRRSYQFDKAHKRVAARHGTNVVEQRVDDSRKLWMADRDLWAADLFHVSGKGHERWADVTWRTVEPLVSELSGAI